MVTNYRNAETFEVPEDGIYRDHRGSPIAFKKGDRIPVTRAAQFKDFNVSLDGRNLSGITLARRSEGAAPENRAESAPENCKEAEPEKAPAKKSTKKDDE